MATRRKLRAGDTTRLTGIGVRLAGESKDGRRRFRMIANTGAPFGRMFGDAVVDLAGIECPAKLPMLVNHDADRVAGYADESALADGGFELAGFLSAATPDGQYVADLSDEEFPWTASLGLTVGAVEEIQAGAEVEVNGQTLRGPIDVWRKTRLFETSFITANPADKDTRAEVMAQQEKTHMDPKEFAKAHPEAVEAWREEGRVAALSGLKETLAACEGREGFAAKSYAAGLSAIETKAALADVYREELASQRAAAAKSDEDAAAASEKQTADANEIAKLKQASGHPGVDFKPAESDEKTAAEKLAALPVEQRLAAKWSGDKQLRSEFGGVFNAYVAYVKRHGEEG